MQSLWKVYLSNGLQDVKFYCRSRVLDSNKWSPSINVIGFDGRLWMSLFDRIVEARYDVAGWHWKLWHLEGRDTSPYITVQRYLHQPCFHWNSSVSIVLLQLVPTFCLHGHNSQGRSKWHGTLVIIPAVVREQRKYKFFMQTFMLFANKPKRFFKSSSIQLLERLFISENWVNFHKLYRLFETNTFWMLLANLCML